MQSFTAIGLNDAVAQAMSSFGFAGPTEIQTKAAAPMLAGKDLYLSSATGSGKTFAYLAPMLCAMPGGSRQVVAIIAAPTHDLAAQLFRECERMIRASGLDFEAAQFLGSVPLDRQLKRLSQKPNIVVGSAGRIRDLLANGHLDASACRYLVMDEADRLFEKETQDIACDILDAMPGSCAKVLVSATIPERTIERSARWFREPERVFLDSTEALRDSIEHWCFHASSRSKVEFLRKFEAAVKPARCLIFASSNASIFTISKKLDYLGFPAAVLKSDHDGQDRRSALDNFCSGAVRYLITTDLGARGLDVPDVSHVLSFDLPEEPSVYVHRAGRTGRAGKRGISIALTDLVELKRASKIAVRYGFAFVCKILDSGHVHDIEPDNFFAQAEEEEALRKNVRLEAPERASSALRRPRPSAPTGPAYKRENRSSQGAVRRINSTAGHSDEQRPPRPPRPYGRTGSAQLQNGEPRPQPSSAQPDAEAPKTRGRPQKQHTSRPSQHRGEKDSHSTNRQGKRREPSDKV